MEHLARHRKAARLPQTVGIASALLTAQALAAGRPAARWLLQQEEWPAEGSLEEQASIRARRAAAVALPDAVVEACLLGRGDAAALARRLLEHGELPVGGGGQQLSSTAANVLIGGLGVQGQAEEAFAVYGWVQEADGQQPGPRPDWWTHRLLLYAALNAREESTRLDLTLRALAAARLHAREMRSRGGSVSLGWDQKTRRAVLAALQQGEHGTALLVRASASGDEHDQKVARLRALLSLKG